MNLYTIQVDLNPVKPVKAVKYSRALYGRSMPWNGYVWPIASVYGLQLSGFIPTKPLQILISLDLSASAMSTVILIHKKIGGSRSTNTLCVLSRKENVL